MRGRADDIEGSLDGNGDIPVVDTGTIGEPDGADEQPGEGWSKLGFGWWTKPDGSRWRELKFRGGNRGGRPAGIGKSKRRTVNIGGGTAATAPKAPRLDLSGLDGFLLVAHQQAARLTQTPELEITETEAREFSKAVGAVARHYAPEVSQKWIDWTALISTLGTIYGTRLYLIAERRQQTAQPPRPMMPPAPPAPAPANGHDAAAAIGEYPGLN